MPKRSIEKSIQGGLSLGAYGAVQGNKLRKMYGRKATAIGAGVGAVGGAVTGYLSGVPDTGLSDKMYDGVAESIRMSTMKNARQAGDVVADDIANVNARRNIGGPLTAGVEAANRGKILSEANQALIPVEQQIAMEKGRERLGAERAEEYELRQGWQDAALATGAAAHSIVGDMNADYDAEKARVDAEYEKKMGKVLPSGFSMWNPQKQIGFMVNKGIPVPEGWQEMSPTDKMAYLQGHGMNIMGPGAHPDPEPWRTKGFPHFKPAYTAEEDAAFNATQYGHPNPDWEAQKDAAETRTGKPVEVTPPPTRTNNPLRVNPLTGGMMPSVDMSASKPANPGGEKDQMTAPRMSELYPATDQPVVMPPIGVEGTRDPMTAPRMTDLYPAKVDMGTPRLPAIEVEAERLPPRHVIPGGDTDPNNPQATPQWMKEWSPNRPTSPPVEGTGLPPVVPEGNMPIGAQPRDPSTGRHLQQSIWDEASLNSLSMEELRELENDIRNRMTSNRDAPGSAPPPNSVNPQRLQEQLSLIQKVRNGKIPGASVEGGNQSGGPPEGYMSIGTSIGDPQRAAENRQNLGEANSRNSQQMLRDHEGFRAKPYLDTTGKLHIGYGRNLDDNPLSPHERAYLGVKPGESLQQITQEQGEWLFQNDLTKATASAETILGETYGNLDPARQSVITNMAYQFGAAGFAEFKDMISALQKGDYQKAADAIIDSAFYRDPKTRGRAQELSNIMRTGGKKPGEQPANTIPTVLHDVIPKEVQDNIKESAKTPATAMEMQEFKETMRESHDALLHPSSPLAAFATEPYVWQVLQQTAAAMGDDRFSQIIRSMHQLA